MHKIEFSFSIHLDNLGAETTHHYGPLFTKWLPNSKDDAISLSTGAPNSELKVWFSRRGFIENGFIEFDLLREEVDQTIMSQQAVLEAGPLSGILITSDVTDEELSALEKDVKNDPEYLALGKRIARIIQKPISKLLSIFRVNFGQYWIQDLAIFDSQLESLGSYCRNKLQLRWRSNPESIWKEFCPTVPVIERSVILNSTDYYNQYISQADYSQIPKILSQIDSPSSSFTALMRASENLDRGDLSYAIIEVCTALEISMSSYIRSKYAKHVEFKDVISSFFNQKKETQLFFISLGIPDISQDTLLLAIEGIKLRNEIVHEGFVPEFSKTNKDKVSALLSVTAKLLPGPFYRFPSANPGNAIIPENE